MERYLQILNIALEAVFANRFRSILTALGIIFGVAAVIAMMAIGTGAQKEILDQIKLVGVNNIIITPIMDQQNQGGGSEEEDGKTQTGKYSPGLTLKDASSIKDILPILKDNLPRALGEDRLPVEKIKHELLQLPMTAIKARRVVELAEQGDLVVRMANADRAYLLAQLARQLRRVGWLIFFLALAFYLQRLQLQWTLHLSFVSLLLAALTLRRQR